MDRIRIGYPAGYFRFFWIRIGFGYLFLKKIGSGQDQDICLIQEQMSHGGHDGASVFFTMVFIFTKNQNDFVSMCCTHHNQ